MPRVFNFSAGPAMLAEEVLERAREEMLDYRGCGMSVMEMSHRSSEFSDIISQAETDLRELLQIPLDYRILFLQGGATSQFAMVPMNLLRDKTSADYVDTGHWSQKAIAEAKRYCNVHVAASSEDANFSYAPAQDRWQLDPAAAYVHYTPNETIGGVEFHWVPDTDELPLVADMSSTILSRSVPIQRFGLIYAGAQKNLGIAGLTVVIVRDDLIGRTVAGTPSLYDYHQHAHERSMVNTPPTFAIYIAGLVFQWLKRHGGVGEMERINIAKAQRLYDYLDSGGFYRCPTLPRDRSRMNVPFALRDAALDDKFLKQAAERGLLNLKSHRAVGGMRASLYNAMPMTGVEALMEFMREFENRHG